MDRLLQVERMNIDARAGGRYAPAMQLLEGAVGTRARWGQLFFFLLALWGAPLHAQGEQPGGADASGTRSAPSRADLEEARARFVAGRAAIEAGRWADAVENFERAYALSSAPSALYNEAVALRALGRYLEARDALRLLLRRHADKLSATRREEAERYLQEAETQVASVRLVGLAHAVPHIVRLDARVVEDDGSRPLVLETDPGEHVVEVSRPHHEPFEWHGTLEPGETTTLQVTLRPHRSDPLDTPEPARDRAQRREGGGGLLSSPWFWVGSAVVLAAAGGAAWWYLEGRGPVGPTPLSSRPVDLGAWR